MALSNNLPFPEDACSVGGSIKNGEVRVILVVIYFQVYILDPPLNLFGTRSLLMYYNKPI